MAPRRSAPGPTRVGAFSIAVCGRRSASAPIAHSQRAASTPLLACRSSGSQLHQSFQLRQDLHRVASVRPRQSAYSRALPSSPGVHFRSQVRDFPPHHIRPPLFTGQPGSCASAGPPPPRSRFSAAWRRKRTGVMAVLTANLSILSFFGQRHIDPDCLCRRWRGVDEDGDRVCGFRSAMTASSEEGSGIGSAVFRHVPPDGDNASSAIALASSRSRPAVTQPGRSGKDTP